MMQDTLTAPVRRQLDFAERIVPMIKPAGAAEPVPFRALRRILMPFDLSRAGICALRIVTDLAEKSGATIHLLHVVRPFETNGVEPKSSRADDHVAEASERLLKHWVRRVVQGRARTFVSIRIGEPVDVIVARAVATRADLIVMTSRSAGDNPFEAQRSSAERVSRLAPCAVLTIPEKCSDQLAYANSLTGNWRAILVPVDFSAAAGEALRFAAQMAKDTGATLLLAHGCDPEESEAPLLRMRLKTWASRLLDDGVAYRIIIWPGGHSLYAILSESIRAEANLIVLPTAAQSWARRLRAGSITDGVLRQASCPVVCINEKVFSSEE